MSLDIIGHEDVLRAFDRFIAAERLGHAYLLVGPAGVGKTTIARWLATRLLCVAAECGSPPPHAPPPRGKGGNTKNFLPLRGGGGVRGGGIAGQQLPCGVCHSCTAVERGTHPDVHVLRADGEAIPIDAVREWTTALSRTSLFAGWKVGIVEGAEQLTEAAANACLKAIEEPTPRTVILLTASSRRRVLPTIASRCALVSCRRVPQADLEAALCERGTAVSDARAIAAAADGCPGVALAQLQTPERRQKFEELQDAARAVLSGPLTDRLRQIDTLLRDRGNDRAAASQSALQLIEAFRQLGREQLRSASAATLEHARWMELLARAPEHLAANASPRLLIETIVVTAPDNENPKIEALNPKQHRSSNFQNLEHLNLLRV